MWDGTDVVPSPLPHATYSPPRKDIAHLRYVRDVFLPRARAEVVLPPTAIRALDEFARDLERRAARREPVSAGASATRRPAAAGAPPVSPPSPRPVVGAGTPTARPGAAALLPFEPRPYVPKEHKPGPVARWWDRTKDAVGSDLAAHGLAYLGVLLLFVGVFGLVAFAFGDVAENMRPVAELGIALAPFLASWMLLRRGAEIAGRALETAGGLLLPIMLVTSFLDGVPVPPDLTGPALVVTLTAVTAVVSAAYAWWSLRHRSSTLRYLVAPVGWLAVALATMGIGRETPSGRGVATVTAVQVAAVSIAILASLVWAWVRTRSFLAGPTFTSTVPALVILAPIAVATWVVGGWPEVPIAVTGVAGLLVLELMIGHLRREVVTTIQPLWWAVVGLALVPSMGTAPAAVCAAAGFLALLELESSDGSSTRTMELSAAGLVVSVALSWSQPWWAFAVAAALTLWAHARRRHPYSVPRAALALDLAAALLPMAAVVAFGMASQHAPAAVLAGSVLALLASWPATRRRGTRLLRRDDNDHFWVLWWDAAMVVSVMSVALMAAAAWPTVVSAQWMLVAALGVLVLAAAAGPLPATLRPWVLLGLASWCWVLVGGMLALPIFALCVVPAAVALAVVTAPHVWPHAMTGWQQPGSTAWAGAALALGAILVASGALGWPLAVTVGLATASWLVLTLFTALDRSPAVDALVMVTGPPARALPGVVGVVGLPATVLLSLDAAGLVPVTSPWAPVVLAATAVVYGAATRLRLGDLVGPTVGWAACVAAVVAPALCREPLPALVSLLALVATVLVLPTTRRPTAMVWLGWAAAAPIVALGLERDTAVYDGVTTELAFAATVVGVGAALLLAGAALDLAGRAWTPVWRPSRPAYTPLVVLGAGEVLAGLAVATSVVPPTTAGWITLSVAVLLVATAALSRAWALLGVASALGWVSVLQLRGDDLLQAPWVSVVVTVALLGATELAHRVVHDERLWVRCDWLLAAVAHVTALTALAAAGTGTSLALTLLAVGLVAIAVAVRLLRYLVVAIVYAGVGTLLVLTGAAVAGPGWLALALAVASLACSFLAARTTAAARWLLLCSGAVSALGAWLSLTGWLEWTSGEVLDRTVLLAAAIALVTAALLRWTRVDRTVLLVRGGLAVLTSTFAPLVTFAVGLGDVGLTVTGATCAALAGTALAAVLAARPLAQQSVRFAAVGYLLVAAAELSWVLDLDAVQQLSALSVATVACALALAGPWGRERWTAWRAPVAALGVATTALSLAVAVGQLPDTTLLTAALLVAAIMSAGIAVETRSIVAQACIPLLVCGSWLAYAGRAVEGNAQWFVVPVGLTLLVEAGLLRHRLRLTGQNPASAEIVVVELAGVGCLVGPSFVQAFSDSLGYAALAAVLGLLIAGWGLLTRVRRRVTEGVVVAFAGLLVLVGVPLSQLLPAWTSVTLWVTIACVGLLAIVGATLLEKGRAVVRAGLDSFREMTEGWE